MSHVATQAEYGSSAGASSHTLPLTDPTNIAIGNFLVLMTYATADRTLSVSDDAGNTWTVEAATLNGGGDKAQFAWCEVVNAYGAGDGVTLSYNASSNVAASIEEFGPLTGLADSVFAHASAPNTSFDSGATGSTPSGDLLVLGFLGYQGTNTTITPADVNYNATGVATSAGTARSIATFYQDATGTDPFEFDGSLAASRGWTAFVLVFEAAPSGPPEGWVETVEFLSPTRWVRFEETTGSSVVDEVTSASLPVGGTYDLNVPGAFGSGIELNNGHVLLGDISGSGTQATYVFFVKTTNGSASGNLTDLWGGGPIFDAPFDATPILLFELNGNSSSGLIPGGCAATFGILNFLDPLSSTQARNWEVEEPTVDWQDDENHLFIVTFDTVNDTSRFWIDGVEQTLTWIIEGNAPSLSNYPMMLGQATNADGNGDPVPQGTAVYIGDTDEFIVFSQLLDTSEIDLLVEAAGIVAVPITRTHTHTAGNGVTSASRVLISVRTQDHFAQGGNPLFTRIATLARNTIYNALGAFSTLSRILTTVRNISHTADLVITNVSRVITLVKSLGHNANGAITTVNRTLASVRSADYESGSGASAFSRVLTSVRNTSYDADSGSTVFSRALTLVRSISHHTRTGRVAFKRITAGQVVRTVVVAAGSAATSASRIVTNLRSTSHNAGSANIGASRSLRLVRAAAYEAGQAAASVNRVISFIRTKSFSAESSAFTIQAGKIAQFTMGFVANAASTTASRVSSASHSLSFHTRKAIARVNRSLPSGMPFAPIRLWVNHPERRFRVGGTKSRISIAQVTTKPKVIVGSPEKQVGVSEPNTSTNR